MDVHAHIIVDLIENALPDSMPSGMLTRLSAAADRSSSRWSPAAPAGASPAAQTAAAAGAAR